MEPDDGFADDEPASPLLPPDDRLWRHPSEVAFEARQPSRHRRSGDPRLWQVGMLSGLVGALLTAGLVAVGGGFPDEGGGSGATVVERLVAPSDGAVASPATSSSSVVEIAERVRPAIVQIKASGGGGRGAGSGVVFRSDGHVLTNHHVVDGARRVTVVMPSGGEEPARLVGSDPETDIAVVKIDRSDVTSAALGSATTLRVGQTAVAIGSPLGLAGGPSVSVGVVSALGRQLDGVGPPLLDMIQTDAPIAPGSSGGALVDESGSVIGITTAIAISAVGAEGLGFATPIDIARQVAAQLISAGRVQHPWLGIEGMDLDPTMAKSMGLVGGAVVKDVLADSPAARAGIKDGDVITAVDRSQVRSMGGLKVLLRSRQPGEAVTLAIRNGDKARTAEVKLGERPNRP